MTQYSSKIINSSTIITATTAIITYPFKDAAIIVMGIEVGAVGTTDGVGTVVKVTIGEQTQNRGWYYDQVTKRLYN